MSHLFKNIDEMLLRLYYVYSKSPKKCPELTDIVKELEEVYEFPKGGNFPVRGRWRSYKHNTLQSIVHRYGGYINQLATCSLIEDNSINSADRARMKGCLHVIK